MASESQILHLVVIGFHHKKGYQVDYSYPPLSADKDSNSVECPDGWKYLPTLALPDGSHNFGEDTVFFNLPSLDDPKKTIYGISCYRQIDSEQLKNRTADVTRSTVQKAVCALITRPLYGYIEVKLSLIAQSFFDQGDFSDTDIIRTAYKHLEASLNESSTAFLSHIHVGLSLRDVVLRWRYKILILFKLMLLQKRVICFGSPVRPVCSLILSILSLHPDLLESGIAEAACVKALKSPTSPTPEKPIDFDNTETIGNPIIDAIIDDNDTLEAINERKVSICLADQNSGIIDNNETKLPSDENIDKLASERSTLRTIDTFANNLQQLNVIEANAWNAPLPIFTNGTLCLPYLSLSYMDFLTDPSVNGFIIGTSNILFRQKSQLMDVFIDVGTNTIEAHSLELRRQITLTTEDLRFIDYVVRHAQQPKEDAEGSEKWIRKQFQGYMLAMLRTAYVGSTATRDVEHFNSSFITAWKQTDCYTKWAEDFKSSELDLERVYAGHPFAGSLSVGDMKLKFTQTINNSESARKLNQAVNNTSKAVGGAISQAKDAFTSLWSTFNVQPVTATTDPIANNTESNDNRNDAVSNDKPIKIAEDGGAGTAIKHGIVEIGRDANAFDSNNKNNEIVDI